MKYVRRRSWATWFKPERGFGFRQGTRSERARIVAWLRSNHIGHVLPGIPDAIERGDHLALKDTDHAE